MLHKVLFVTPNVLYTARINTLNLQYFGVSPVGLCHALIL